MIIAMGPYWQGDEYMGPQCGKQIKITNMGGGQENNGVGNVVVATVADRCAGCDMNHLGKRLD